jgi:hypothetical protein
VWRPAAGIALVLALVGVACAANSARPRGTPVVWTSDTYLCRNPKLVRVDPNTLSILRGPQLKLPDFAGGFKSSPDRNLAVVGGTDHGRLVFVDPIRMRRLGMLKLGGLDDSAATIAWPRRRTLVALDVEEDAHRVGLTKVVVVDPVRRRVVRELRFSWWAALAYATTRSGRTAVLLVSWTHLTEPRLVVVDADGRVRQRRLRGFAAGVGFDRSGETRRFPAMAVDPRAERAFVLLEHEPIAVIDLRTLRIRSGFMRLPAPARRDAGPPHGTGTNNPTHGPQREAAWIGAGRFAFTGFDSWTVGHAERDAGIGLHVFDTRTWSVQMLRAGKFSFMPGTARVVALGGQSLFVFGKGKLAYSVSAAHGWGAAAGRLLVGTRRGHDYRVLDPADGRRVGTAPASRLLATGLGYCA